MILSHCNFFSKTLLNHVDVDVLLPSVPDNDCIGMTLEEIYTPVKPYPVLYLLHGALDDHSMWLRHTDIEALADELIQEYKVKCDNRTQPIRMLSGGNMQKVVTAREFTAGASLIIANQPTRGIDIGASDFIRRRLVDLRTQGAGVLLISADLNEVLEISDSLIVMHNGRIAAYFPDASKVGEDELGEYMLGVRTMSEEEIREVADHE